MVNSKMARGAVKIEWDSHNANEDKHVTCFDCPHV